MYLWNDRRLAPYGQSPNRATHGTPASEIPVYVSYAPETMMAMQSGIPVSRAQFDFYHSLYDVEGQDPQYAGSRHQHQTQQHDLQPAMDAPGVYSHHGTYDVQHINLLPSPYDSVALAAFKQHHRALRDGSEVPPS